VAAGDPDQSMISNFIGLLPHSRKFLRRILPIVKVTTEEAGFFQFGHGNTVTGAASPVFAADVAGSGEFYALKQSMRQHHNSFAIRLY